MKKITVIMLSWESKSGKEYLPVSAKEDRLDAKELCTELNNIIDEGDLNALRTKMVQECMMIPPSLLMACRRGDSEEYDRLKNTLNFFTRACILK